MNLNSYVYMEKLTCLDRDKDLKQMCLIQRYWGI
jgi:hypothetical protein